MDIRGTCISSTKDEHGPIFVYETKNTRILSFDGKIYQSSMKLNDINGLHLDYTQAMMAGLLFVPIINTATILGLGAGSMAKNLINNISELKVHVVEYREEVVNIAKKYFCLPCTDHLSIHIDDATNYIQNTNIKSDIIFSDLYNSEGIEPKQVQSSYLHNCKNALNKQGVLVLNICHTTPKLQKELNEILKCEFKNQLLSLEVGSGNTIVLAFKNTIPTMNKEELLSMGKRLQEKMNIPMQHYIKLICDNKKL